MNSLLDDNDADIEDHHGRKDREITLGTTVVLGIFFALAVFGAVMFGFGYSIGTKHVSASVAAAEANPNTTFNGFKPPSGKSAGDLAKAPAPESVSVPFTQPPAPLPRATPAPAKPVDPDSQVVGDPQPPARTVATPQPVQPAPVARAATAPAPAKPVDPDSQVVGDPQPPARTVATPQPVQPAPVARAAAAPAAPAIAAGGSMMVQIAAVSHQEDAESLVNSLRRRSYAVAIHQEPQDRLLHVQVGPFATRKDADAMRLRLQADGFNAIVKDTSH